MIGVAVGAFGCSTSEGPYWADEAIVPFSGRRVANAAYNSLFDIQTVLPVAAAGILAIGDWDEEVSDWAVDQTPIFGSHASDFSDYLLWGLGTEIFVTGIIIPGPEDPADWVTNKLRATAVEAAAFGAGSGIHKILRETVTRRRPDQRSHHSFPSGHAINAFSASTISNRNLMSINMSPGLRTTIQTGNILTASIVGWARIEAGRHFPSDVLAGAAIGHFLSSFIHDAFMGLPDDTRFGSILAPSLGEFGAQLSISF